MNYELILKDIKPTLEEQNDVDAMSYKLVSFLNETCEKEDISAKIAVVGSVAKHTALKGKSDIDIFMAFPLDVSEDTLKQTGLYLAHKCSDAFNGDASHHFASHPYVQADIEGYDVDFYWGVKTDSNGIVLQYYDLSASRDSDESDYEEWTVSYEELQ